MHVKRQSIFIGPKGRVENLRVLCKVKLRLRYQGLKNLSWTLKLRFGPLGTLGGSPGITLEGPKGTCDITYGVICALRHIHMSPEDALSLGLKDRDVVMIRVKGQRALIFGDVLVWYG